MINGDNWIMDAEGNTLPLPSERFMCDGHYEPYDGHEIRIYEKGLDVEDDANIIWFTFWYMGPQSGSHRRLSARLKNAWKMLRGHPVVFDEFVFNIKEARRMGEYLVKMVGKKGLSGD